MEITTPDTSVDVRRIARARDDLIALLAGALAELPDHLAVQPGARFPLLDAARHQNPEAARTLVLIGALTHHNADERRTAEYLLRNRHRMPAVRLLAAARCAAEMDVRHARDREICVAPHELPIQRSDDVQRSLDVPSVGEVVADFAAEILGTELPDTFSQILIDSSVVFMRVAERHALNGGTLPAIIAMRSDARPKARLAANLIADGMPGAVATRVARVLVGPDGAPEEAALVLWAARRARAEDVPPAVQTRWMRELTALASMVGHSKQVA